MSVDDESNGRDGADSSTPEQTRGVEIVTLSDEGGRGVYLSCAAELSPIDLLEGLCDLIAQMTRAIVSRPQVERAGDLGLSDDVF